MDASGDGTGPDVTPNRASRDGLFYCSGSGSDHDPLIHFALALIWHQSQAAAGCPHRLGREEDETDSVSMRSDSMNLERSLGLGFRDWGLGFGDRGIASADYEAEEKELGTTSRT